jgi:hypothetical protein
MDTWLSQITRLANRTHEIAYASYPSVGCKPYIISMIIVDWQLALQLFIKLYKFIHLP